jgi:hypothetical protein
MSHKSGHIIISRFAYLREVTLGTLEVGDLKLATIERPWIPNPAGKGGIPRESCIPDGTYHLQPHQSERFPRTYALIGEAQGVYYQQRPAGQTWGRTAILIHVGNFVHEVIGCIAVGLKHGGTSCVTSSRTAMDALRSRLKDGHFEVTIQSRGAIDP